MKVFYERDIVEINGKVGKITMVYKDKNEVFYNIALLNGGFVHDAQPNELTLVQRESTRLYMKKCAYSIEEAERLYLCTMLQAHSPTDRQVELLYDIYLRLEQKQPLSIKDFCLSINTYPLQDYIDLNYYES